MRRSLLNSGADVECIMCVELEVIFHLVTVGASAPARNSKAASRGALPLNTYPTSFHHQQ